MKRGGGGFFDTVKNMFKSEKPRNITRKVYKGVKKRATHVYNKLKETKNYVTSRLSTFDARIKKIFIKLLDLLGKEFKEDIAKIHGLNTSFSNKIYKLYFVLKKKLTSKLFTMGRSKNIRGGAKNSNRIWKALKFFGKILGTLVIVLVIIGVCLLCGFGFIFGIGLKTTTGVDISELGKVCPVVLSLLNSNISFFSWGKETQKIPDVKVVVDKVGGDALSGPVYDIDGNLASELELLKENFEGGEVGGFEQALKEEEKKEKEEEEEKEDDVEFKIPFNGVPLPGLVDESHPKQSHRLLPMFRNKASAKPNDGISVSLNPPSKISQSLPVVNPQISTIMGVKAQSKPFYICKYVLPICKSIIGILLETRNPKNKAGIERLISKFKEDYNEDLDVSILECRQNNKAFNKLFENLDKSEKILEYGETINAVIFAMNTDTKIQEIRDIIKNMGIIEQSYDTINGYMKRTQGISLDKFQQLVGLLQKQSKASELPPQEKPQAIELPSPEQTSERVADLELELNEEEKDDTIGEPESRLSCKELLDAITDLYNNISNIYAPSKFYKGFFYYDVNKTKIKALFLENYTIDAIIKLNNKLQDEKLINCISPTQNTYINVCYILDFLKRWVPTDQDYGALNTAIDRNKEYMKELQDLILEKKPQFKNPIVPPRGLGFGFLGGKTKRSKKQYKTKRTIKRR